MKSIEGNIFDETETILYSRPSVCYTRVTTIGIALNWQGRWKRSSSG